MIFTLPKTISKLPKYSIPIFYAIKLSSQQVSFAYISKIALVLTRN